MIDPDLVNRPGGVCGSGPAIRALVQACYLLFSRGVITSSLIQQLANRSRPSIGLRAAGGRDCDGLGSGRLGLVSVGPDRASRAGDRHGHGQRLRQGAPALAFSPSVGNKVNNITSLALLTQPL